MDSIPRPQLAIYVAAAIAVALIGTRYLRESKPAPMSTHVAGRPVAVKVGSATSGFAVVQVVGEVGRPGVYRMRAGERVDDAVRRAGGATARADLAGVNLAAKLEDGRQVIVPARGATGAVPAADGAAAVGGAGSAAPAAGQPINLNTATAEQLDGLDGVGPATAQKILAYRRQHGGFRSVSELDQVAGIGPKKLAALKPLVRV